MLFSTSHSVPLSSMSDGMGGGSVAMKTVRVGSGPVSATTALSKQALQRLLVRLAKALFMYGAPSYRVEERIENVARSKKILVELIVQPSSILMTFGDTTATSSFMDASNGPLQQTTFFFKVLQIQNMGKLQDVDSLARSIADVALPLDELHISGELGEEMDGGGQLDALSSTAAPIMDGDYALLSNRATMMNVNTRLVPRWCLTWFHWMHKEYLKLRFKPKLHIFDSGGVADCLQALEAIAVSDKTSYPLWLMCLANAGLSSISGVLIFQGHLKDAIILLAIGALNGLLMHFGQRYAVNALEVLVPFIIGVLCNLIVVFQPDVCLGTITLSALVPLFPGVAITLAMLEMAANNMQAGSTRIFFSFIRSLKLGFGLSLASRLVHSLTGTWTTLQCDQMPDVYWYAYLLIIPFSACTCITLRAHWHQWPMMCTVSLLGVTVHQLCLLILSREISNVVAAFCIGLASNMYARVFNDIALASILSAIMFMVPGSVGVIGFYQMIRADVASSGTNFAVDMIVKAMSLALGLYLSTLVIFPILRSKARKEILTL